MKPTTALLSPHRSALLGPLAALALLAGCASPSPVAPTAAAPVQTAAATPVVAAPAPTPAPAAAATGTAQSSVSTVDLAARNAAASTRSAAPVAAAAMLAAPTQRTVYFDFDSFAIKSDFQSLIEGHARVLARERRDRSCAFEAVRDQLEFAALFAEVMRRAKLRRDDTNGV
jgi:outer membrane protein OmpA-like peptidoglycan-associated protein